MRTAIFKWMMLIAAAALIGIALLYIVNYFRAVSALATSDMVPFLRQSMLALWVGFCVQSGLVGILFAVAAVRPQTLSRPMLVICGLIPLLQGVLVLSFVHSFTGMLLLAFAALCVVIAALVWPPPPVKILVTPAPGAPLV